MRQNKAAAQVSSSARFELPLGPPHPRPGLPLETSLRTLNAAITGLPDSRCCQETMRCGKKLRGFEAPANSNEPLAFVLSAHFKAASVPVDLLSQTLRCSSLCLQCRPSGQAPTTAPTPTAAAPIPPQGRRPPSTSGCSCT